MAKPELGKFLLWKFFSSHKNIRPYLPDTRRFTTQAFQDMLAKYKMVYVKPSGGSMGRGVMKVWQSSTHVYVKKTVQPAKSFSSRHRAALYLAKDIGGKGHIIQRGIHLAQVGGRPLDIRVMMQRTRPGGPWHYSGMIAKIAGPRSIVTNVALSKGRVMEVEDALRQSLGFDTSRVKRKIEEMKQLAFRAANHFDGYQFYRELGFDMAVDTNGKLWLIEENTGPSHRLFQKLKSNQKMYWLIESRYGQFARARSKSQPVKRAAPAKRA